ncbi:MAG TPA: hypothetical protein VER33_03485, partial [Polyangiaceae bacterium]|nr:hypothetical protein [Polyangiaceae bacterium]
MDLVELVHASREVSATRARSAKVERLAALLAGLTREEVSVAVGMLIGEPRQGRLGIGGALLARATAPPAAAPSLSLSMVDQVLSRL